MSGLNIVRLDYKNKIQLYAVHRKHTLDSKYNENIIANNNHQRAEVAKQRFENKNFLQKEAYFVVIQENPSRIY